MISTANAVTHWRKGSSFALLAFLSACGSAGPTPDLLLTNAALVTLASASPTSGAIAVTGGRITCVGDCQPGPKTRILDLSGRTVLPGFADSHLHLSGVGFREMELNLEGTQSLDQLLAGLAARVSQTRPGEWIVGRGWIEAQWDPPVFPTAADLDRFSPENPVYLARADGHAGVANSKALQIAGVTGDTKPPLGGDILHDSLGVPTGMLIDRAQSLVRTHMPRQTPEKLREALVRGAEFLAGKGWTQVSVAGASAAELEAIEQLIDEGLIGLRVYGAMAGPSEDAEKLLSEGPRPRHDGRFSVRGVKIVMDGALGSRGAALEQPYSDGPSTSGLLMHEPSELLPFLERALRSGIQIQTHAIGDRANRIMLDLYGQAFAAVPEAERAVAEPRWRIEHAQILRPADIPRFAQLGVIPSMEASHAITDLHFAPARLGPERLAGAYAWRALVDAGSKIAGGSDAPVERGDPLVELYAAAVRKDLNGFSDDDWHREQRLTREEALRTLTDWAAYATFEEDKRGSIEVGKWADFTVLSGNPLEVPEAEIPLLEVAMTIVGGRVIYDSSAR
ncbi:MAG: amidohydrolase family protein [Bryobacterales bacterium]